MSGGMLFGAPISGKGVAAAVGEGRGTVVAPFRAIGKVDGTASITFQSITAMVQYEHKSFEELRVEDYMAGNKGSQEQAQPGAGGFGSSLTSGFGTPTPSPVVAGAFGAPAPAGGFRFGAVKSVEFGAGGLATGEFGLMMDMDVLHHIYHFDGRDLPSDQSEESCWKLCSLFARFAKEMSETGRDTLSGHSPTHYNNLRDLLFRSPKVASHIQFFPGYGCVLILHNDIVQRHDSLSITILGLDSHLHVVHSGHNQYQFSSIAQNYAEIHVGEIGLATKQDFLTRFQKLLDKASCRKGDERSAAGRRQGHQKTPAFIHALLVQALNCNCPEVLPRGGFTDVGLHTGGEARDTSFALVRSLCMWNMNRSFYQNQEVLDKESSLDAVMLYFHSFVLENAIQAIKESAQGGELSHSVLKSISHLWTIMKVICTTAAPLSDEGHDLSAHFVSMTLFKETIMSAQSKWHQACGVKNTIEYTNPLFYAPPIFVPPVASFQTCEGITKSDINLLEKENIEFVHTFFLHKTKSYDVASAHKWAIQMKRECTSSSSSLIVYLRQIEKMFWTMSKPYLDEPLKNTTTLVQIAGILDCYRESVDHCLSSTSEAKHFSSLHVRMRSIELLATWLVYCIIFNATRGIFPAVLEGFGVALRFQDLSHLVLQDENHIVVLKRVIHFLGGNHFGEDKEIFSMRHDQDWDSATFQMGHRYSKLFLSSTLAKEKKDAEERVTKHWQEVRRKYILAAHLRSELIDLREDLDRADEEVRNAEDAHHYWSDVARLARNERSSAGSLVYEKESEVEEAEKAPPPVIQPLPSNDDKALKILFFMNMSDEFKVLSRLSLVAQQLLVPKPWEARCGGQDGIQILNVFDQIKVEEKEISWCDHYNTFQTCNYHTPSEERKGSCQWLDISMHVDVPRPTDMSLSAVDFLQRRKGIWHPDNNNVRLVWHGGSLAHDRHISDGEFNPFAIRCHLTAAYFTERLPNDSQELQFAVFLPPNVYDDKSRGNRAYSSQYLRKNWLDKEGFLQFASLRQFPSQVLRKLVIALKSESLPLQEESVQILFRQAAFQIGSLRLFEERLDFLWRMDFEEIRSTCLALIGEIADKFAQTPCFYKAFVILAELFSYFSSAFAHTQVPEVKSVTEVLSSAALSWALSCEDDIFHSAPECVSSIRSRQVVYFRTAALCLVHKKDLTIKEATNLLTCIVRAKNAFVEDKDDLEERDNLDQLCTYFLSDNKSYRLQLTKGSKTLSEALKCVVFTVPASLVWIPDEASDYCFSSDGSDGHAYAMNILTGVVLIDGMPSNTLPSSITNDKRYEMIYGKNNFEVINKGEQLETVRPIQGCLYRFRKARDSLVIEESMQIVDESDIESCWNDPLELLDTNQIDTWGQHVPKKLKDSYSHWLSRKRKIILFRSKDFRDRNCAYQHDMMYCKRYNAFDQETVSDDRLVIHDSPILSILERMETKDMIHTFFLPNDTYIESVLLFELYRFSLTFSLEQGSGVLKCLEIAGFQLAPAQHLEGMLPGLRNYLVLEHSSDVALKKVIVPFGEIRRDDDGSIRIILATKDLSPTRDNVDEEMQLFQYDIHPRFETLEAQNTTGRLFLAALFAATMSIVPDRASGMTGEEQACILVRQCQVVRPFSPIEMKVLHNLKILSSGKSATLSLLCHDLQRSAIEFGFLHHSSHPPAKVSDIVRSEFSNDASAYLAMRDPVSSRVLLSPSESRRIIGSVKSQSRMKTSRRGLVLLELDECPVSRECIDYVDVKLFELWSEESGMGPGVGKEFPVKHSTDTDLDKAVYGELAESWKLHCQESDVHLRLEFDIIESIQKIEKIVTSVLSTVEVYLLDSLTRVSSKSNWHSQALEYLKLCNVIPTVTKREIVALACDFSKVSEYNPLLSKTSMERIHQGVIMWLELCVYQDKCLFLLNTANGHEPNENKDFVRELTSRRSWDAKVHPYWLVYEVEQGIRIRPEQYEVAKHLMNNNGHVIQLNMGLGKTRVILPMLILYYSYQASHKRIPRLHILSTLFSEVCEHFHNTLGASVLNRRLFTLPFRRDVELDHQKVRSIVDLVKHCEQERGFFVVAPEHRLSLELKVKELHLDGQHEMSESLRKVVSNSWQDVFDEIDEILHHRYQLVYSIGTVEPLPQMLHRWKAAQALLKLLRRETCQVDGLVVVTNDKSAEAFPSIVADNEVDSAAFRAEMTRCLLDQCPAEYAWIVHHTKREEMIKIVSEPSANPKDLESKISREHFDDILALRGLLAQDILLHCLKKRYRVDFGVNHSNARTKLAVPFRGADTPSERSEFSHPDCAIVLSILAHYSSGLSKTDLKASFEALLRKGCNFKQSTFANWLSESSKQMDEATYHSINKIDKVDLTNKSQFHVLYKSFHKNPETINFWLNTFVFPRDLDHYPQRLVATPWHLAYNKDNCCVGFSGTNDNHLVLPLQLQQYLPWETEHSIWRKLLSTNGKMLDVVITKTSSCEELGADGTVYEMLLQFITDNRNIDALIDCGALLAGISNRNVAEYLSENLLSKSKGNLRGITFYDESTKEWMILEQSGRCLVKNQSSLKEKDTFALFDEPRCRGVDLKLRPDAIAALSLGQGMCKDKFMQAAGRMRQLQNKQSLIIVGERRIFNEVRQKSARVDVEGILAWVIQNTVQSIVRGIRVWSDQGIFFATERKPQHAVLDEKSDLQSFYGKPVEKSNLSKSAALSRDYHFQRSGYSSNGDERILHVDAIVERCEKYGKGYFVVRSGADEECERELNREIEEEEEEQLEIERVPPRNEIDWDYKQIFREEGINTLLTKHYRFVVALSKFWSDKEGLRRIKWSDDLFCTRNFIKTVVTNAGNAIDNYLRIPDCLIRFKGGQVLLLSDREGAKICELFLERQASGISCMGHMFGHFAFETDPNSKTCLRCDPSNHGISLRDIDCCSMILFNGGTSYPSSQRNTMKAMLSVGINDFANSTVGSLSLSNITGSPEKFISARQKQKDLELSDLEEICNEIICDFEQIGEEEEEEEPPSAWLNTLNLDYSI